MEEIIVICLLAAILVAAGLGIWILSNLWTRMASDAKSSSGQMMELLKAQHADLRELFSAQNKCINQPVGVMHAHQAELRELFAAQDKCIAQLSASLDRAAQGFREEGGNALKETLAKVNSASEKLLRTVEQSHEHVRKLITEESRELQESSKELKSILKSNAGELRNLGEAVKQLSDVIQQSTQL